MKNRKIIEIEEKFHKNKNLYIVLFKQRKDKDYTYCYRPNDLTFRNDFCYALINKETLEIDKSF